MTVSPTTVNLGIAYALDHIADKLIAHMPEHGQSHAVTPRMLAEIMDEVAEEYASMTPSREMFLAERNRRRAIKTE